MVARYQRLVYAIARRTGLDESTAADVFQTVFERLHANPRLAPDRPSAWIGTTAKREGIRLRMRGRREAARYGGRCSSTMHSTIRRPSV
jgi:DNA-directed RNA polymerase specialized sigma24 family protein